MSAVVGVIRQTARAAGRTRASVYLIRWIWGIALGSAVSVASLNHVDNRIMFSVGKGALSLGDAGTGSEDNPWNSTGRSRKSAIF